MADMIHWHRHRNGYWLVRKGSHWTVVRVNKNVCSSAMPRGGNWVVAKDDLEHVEERWYSRTHAFETFKRMSRRKLRW